jgi:hypothetical protein
VAAVVAVGVWAAADREGAPASGPGPAVAPSPVVARIPVAGKLRQLALDADASGSGAPVSPFYMPLGRVRFPQAIPPRRAPMPSTTR